MDSKAPQTPTIHDAETIPSASTTQFEAYAPVDPPSLWKVFKSQVGTKEGWWGDFDWKSMCLPSIFMKEKTKTPFWGLNSRLPLGLALVMGFQHSLAMVWFFFLCLKTKPKLSFFFFRLTGERCGYTYFDHDRLWPYLLELGDGRPAISFISCTNHFCIIVFDSNHSFQTFWLE